MALRQLSNQARGATECLRLCAQRLMGLNTLCACGYADTSERRCDEDAGKQTCEATRLEHDVMRTIVMCRGCTGRCSTCAGAKHRLVSLRFIHHSLHGPEELNCVLTILVILHKHRQGCQAACVPQLRPAAVHAHACGGRQLLDK